MNLNQVSHNIKLAKLDNARWLEYADALIKGILIDKNAIPKYRDDCLPCQWLYEHSDEVNQVYEKIDKVEVEFVHFDIMEQIEILRYDLHENYLQIFKAYLPEINHSIFAFLFRSPRGLSESDEMEAKRQLSEMHRIVDEMEMKLDQLEQSLHYMCELNIA